MPDYLMWWLASRFVDDLDELEDLGILTKEVLARKEAQQLLGRCAAPKLLNEDEQAGARGLREDVFDVASPVDRPRVFAHE